MTRRSFLANSLLALAAARSAAAGDREALEVGAGPHLFLDDYLVAESERLEKVVQAPRRLEAPVLDSARFGTTQPYLTVLQDPDSRRFRLWYNHGPALWHAESEDGLRWENPRVAWDLPRNYGASLLDDRERDPDSERRFKLASWQATRGKEDKPGDDSGMWLGFSTDGFRWKPYSGNPVLPTWPEGYGKPVHEG